MGADLRNEVEEIEETLKADDNKRFLDELADTLKNVLALLVLAEEDGRFTTKDVLRSEIDKIKRRKPWILTGEKLNLDESAERLKAAKAREKTH